MADWIQQNFPDIYRIGMQGVNSWPDAIYATLYMTVISFIIGGLLGLVMGLFLVLTGPRGVIENKFVFQILDKITSIFRAIPFIILLAILKGFTYFIVGTNLGMTERLNDFLSEILGKKVKILKVLPNESAQIAAESSLLIMDIVVQFEDGSIANVEIQKIGYLFPGQRSACYSSDLLLRQYKRVRAELGQGFTYRKIQKVYTIVLFEKSNSDFSNFSKEIYIHHFEQKSDTGVEMNLLQEYTFICLDIFSDIIQNEDRKIENRLEEWLVFLSQDDPDMIIKLLNQNADFQEIYEEVYTICLNMERMMEMFSKELAILDRNTVKLMIDEMEEEVAEAKRKADEAERKADEAESRAKQAEHKEKQMRKEIDNLKKELEKMKKI